MTDSIAHSAPANAPAEWAPALAHSRYLTQLLRAHPELIDALTPVWATPMGRDDMRAFLGAAPMADEDQLKRRLRQLRQQAMARVILRDLCGQAPLAEIVDTMTTLAELTVNTAHDWWHQKLVDQYGEVMDARGQPQRLIVIGMGKLGGRELNVSSDIDLIFVFPEDGRTESGRLDAYEFFVRLGKKLIAALNDLTGDGQVFRVDMRLRPNGDSGPLAVSLDSLENYLITQGREWERYAWIKARVLNPHNFGLNDDHDVPAGNPLATLHSIVRPFIFRRYLDFGAINAMRELHVQIRREVARKDMADHIKLGPGGIREIEFIAQVFQLIRGGREPLLQVRPTLKVLALAAERGLLDAGKVGDLVAAYGFLRRLEHRLQYLDDAQTHRLPQTAEDQSRVARSMGFTDYAALLAVLNAHRQQVGAQFDTVFGEPDDATAGEGAATELWQAETVAETAQRQLAELGFQDPPAAHQALSSLLNGHRYQQLPNSNRQRLDALGPRLIEIAAQTAHPDATLIRSLLFLDTICRRGAYLALLQQYPEALRKVADIVGASSWAADYLNRHPIVLDELLDPRLLDAATDWPAFTEDLQRLLNEHADDPERQIDILREMHHAQEFRLLAQDLADVYTVEKISDHLSELADILVNATLSVCWPQIRQRHRPAPQLAVIGYGKLGGKELGYGSDLDIVFLYDDEDTAARENYARLAQRMCAWMSSQTPAGILFETDLRLRPNGDAGLLATSLEAFRDYQLKNAWVWEHQALSRARFCAGDFTVGQKFEAIREEVLRLPRDLTHLRTEVLAMRQKMLDAHATPASESAERFNIKHDPGGLIDVEFIVQYLVLGHAHTHAALTKNLGNIALLRISAELGLIPADLVQPVQNAYRDLRRLQHSRRLNQKNSPEPKAPHAEKIAAVRALWAAVLG